MKKQIHLENVDVPRATRTLRRLAGQRATFRSGSDKTVAIPRFKVSESLDGVVEARRGCVRLTFVPADSGCSVVFQYRWVGWFWAMLLSGLVLPFMLPAALAMVVMRLVWYPSYGQRLVDAIQMGSVGGGASGASHEFGHDASGSIALAGQS